MKRILFIAILTTVLFGVANGQCTATTDDPCVPVNQSILDRASGAVTELKAARDVIAAFASERTMTAAERVAAQTLIKSLNDVLDVRGRIILEYERMQVVYQKVIDMQGQIIDRLTKEIGKPKSAWQKFVAILKNVAILLAGAALTRGL